MIYEEKSKTDVGNSQEEDIPDQRETISAHTQRIALDME